MSRWRFGRIWLRNTSIDRIAVDRHRRSYLGQGLPRKRIRHFRPLASILRHASIVVPGLMIGGWAVESASAQISDDERAIYARAVEFCRANVKRPMALDLDKRVLCFDGRFRSGQDFSLADGLREQGLFVARSFGGDPYSAVKLAERLRERQVTVIVYDYCLSACASYVLLASKTAFVLKGTLVAWHHGVGEYLCPSLAQAKDGGPKRLEKLVCADAPTPYQSSYKNYRELNDWFYRTRIVNPLFEDPPQSAVVRRILRSRFGGKGEYPPNLLWTWHPRYYPSTITTEVVYEAYPDSQEMVDAMAAPLQARVIYDP